MSAMKLVKGASIDIERDEECFRFPAFEPVSEVSCGDEEDDRPATFTERAGQCFRERALRRRALDRGRDLGFAYQS